MKCFVRNTGYAINLDSIFRGNILSDFQSKKNYIDNDTNLLIVAMPDG